MRAWSLTCAHCGPPTGCCGGQLAAPTRSALQRCRTLTRTCSPARASWRSSWCRRTRVRERAISSSRWWSRCTPSRGGPRPRGLCGGARWSCTPSWRRRQRSWFFGRRGCAGSRKKP
eukprot:jgi/Mesen1/864/ME000114S10950